jgi:hypothetical protein
MLVQENSFIHLRVLLVLTDRGNLAQSNWRLAAYRKHCAGDHWRHGVG